MNPERDNLIAQILDNAERDRDTPFSENDLHSAKGDLERFYVGALSSKNLDMMEGIIAHRLKDATSARHHGVRVNHSVMEEGVTPESAAAYVDAALGVRENFATIRKTISALQEAGFDLTQVDDTTIITMRNARETVRETLTQLRALGFEISAQSAYEAGLTNQRPPRTDKVYYPHEGTPADVVQQIARYGKPQGRGKVWLDKEAHERGLETPPHSFVAKVEARNSAKQDGQNAANGVIAR